MATVAYSTHTPYGGSMQMQAATTNVPLIQSTVTQGTDAFAWELSPTSGDDTMYFRISGRATATGIAAALTLTNGFMQFWMRFDSVPTDEEFCVGFDDTDFQWSLRIRTDRKVRFHARAALTSSTATATGAVALTLTSWYRFRVQFNHAGSAFTCLIYDEAGTLVDTISATSVDIGSVTARVYFGWQISTITAIGATWLGSATATFTWYFGSILIDSAAYPDANARIGATFPTSAGTHTGWTLGAGSSTTAAVSETPPNGNSSYLVSTVANAASTFNMQSCASAGITGTLLFCSPCVVLWDVGGAVTGGTRIIENATTTNLTQADPGATVDFHMRGRIYTSTLPSGASATSIAQMDAMQVGVVRDAGTVEIRCGSILNYVGYVPAAVDPPTVTSRLQNIAYNDATVQTTVSGDTITARGVCWNTSANPTTSNSKTTDGTGSGDLVSRITGLSANTVYYARAYATNAGGTTYSTQMQFTTPRDHDTDIGVRGAFERDAPRRAHRRR